jgi:hypothetical protein
VPADRSSAAVPEAGNVTDEDLIGAEAVPVWAARRRVRDPLPGRGLHELAEHDYKPIQRKRGEARPGHLSDLGQRLAAWVSQG